MEKSVASEVLVSMTQYENNNNKDCIEYDDDKDDTNFNMIIIMMMTIIPLNIGDLLVVSYENKQMNLYKVRPINLN